MKINLITGKEKTNYRSLLEKESADFFKNLPLNPQATLTFHFISQNQMSALNKKYRGIDKPTSVLSFPIWENTTSIPKKGIVNLGDIFICLKIIKDEKELKKIIRHALNHLIGKHH